MTTDREWILNILNTPSGDALKAEVINATLGMGINSRGLPLPRGEAEGAFNAAKAAVQREALKSVAVVEKPAKKQHKAPVHHFTDATNADLNAPPPPKIEKPKPAIEPVETPPEQEDEWLKMEDACDLLDKGTASVFNYIRKDSWQKKRQGRNVVYLRSDVERTHLRLNMKGKKK